MEPLTFIGVPIDSVGRSGGTEHGPEALRELGLPAALGGADAGDLAGADPRRASATRRPACSAPTTCWRRTRTLRAAVAERSPPAAGPSSPAAAAPSCPAPSPAPATPSARLGLVHLDGHVDLYDGETSTTGEAADMPISVVLGLGPGGLGRGRRRRLDRAERTALVGFRDRGGIARATGCASPRTLEPPPLLASGAELRAARPRRRRRGGSPPRSPSAGPFWLHFDVDVLDPACFPATDYLPGGGMDWDELRATLHPFLASKR